MENKEEFYNKNIDEILSKFNSNVNGLNNSNKKQNISKYGKNVLKNDKKFSFLADFFAQFKNIMIIILLISSAISIYLAIKSKEFTDLIEGFTILLIVIINAIIGVVQDKKADDAIEKLKAQSVDYVKVLRGGTVYSVASTELTVGEIIELEAGDNVPADARVIESHNAYFDESMLTGESKPIEKFDKTITKTNLSQAEQKNMIFAGSHCVKGRAKAVIVAVGEKSQLGRIAHAVKSGEKTLTPLQRSIEKISKIIGIVVLSIVVVIFLLEIFVAKQGDIFDALMTSIALAVAAIPESLPAIITIIMALGVQTLAKRNVIIRHLHAVETLGSCEVICSDKTGTITENKMKVVKTFSLSNTPNDTELMNKVCVLCSDVYHGENGLNGDPTELAIYSHALSKGVECDVVRNQNKRVDEIAFDSDRKLMSVVCENATGKTIYTKGATGKLLAVCTKVLIDGKVVNLTADIKEKIMIANNEMAGEALRVISCAYKKFDGGQIENDLIFIGMLGMVDPPRKEVKTAVLRCKTAGLKPVMITGDHKDTAFAVAREVGIATSKRQVITGDEIEAMTDEQLRKVIYDYSVFARVSPEHKIRIVKAFKGLKKIVAMTGDGVNDAGCITNADIGIGMGISGTDVVKSVADMVVSDDNFASIVVAVEEGRKVYANIQKSIQFLLSTNIVEVFAIFIIILFYPENTFLLPVQILFINLVTDSLPAFALGVEKSEPDIMERPPRKNNNLFSGGVGKNIIIQGIIQSVLTIAVYVLAESLWSPHVATTMVFFTIIFMQLLHSINCKTTGSIFDTKLLNNKTFNICFIATLLIDLSVAFIPFMRVMLGIADLNFCQWVIVAVACLLVIPLVEFTKLIDSSHKTKKETA